MFIDFYLVFKTILWDIKPIWQWGFWGPGKWNEEPAVTGQRYISLLSRLPPISPLALCTRPTCLMATHPYSYAQTILPWLGSVTSHTLWSPLIPLGAQCYRKSTGQGLRVPAGTCQVCYAAWVPTCVLTSLDLCSSSCLMSTVVFRRWVLWWCLSCHCGEWDLPLPLECPAFACVKMWMFHERLFEKRILQLTNT